MANRKPIGLAVFLAIFREKQRGVSPIPTEGLIFYESLLQAACRHPDGGFGYGRADCDAERASRQRESWVRLRARSVHHQTRQDLVRLLDGRSAGAGGERQYPDPQFHQPVYHFYDVAEAGAAKLQIRRVFWTKQGWPKLGPIIIKPPFY